MKFKPNQTLKEVFQNEVTLTRDAMNTNHTLGPWKIVENDSPPLEVVTEDGKTGICGVYNHEEPNDGQYGPVTAANARLIAAAPMLLRAVELARAELAKMSCDCDPEKPSPDCPVCACELAIGLVYQ